MMDYSFITQKCHIVPGLVKISVFGDILGCGKFHTKNSKIL